MKKITSLVSLTAVIGMFAIIGTANLGGSAAVRLSPTDAGYPGYVTGHIVRSSHEAALDRSAAPLADYADSEVDLVGEIDVQNQVARTTDRRLSKKRNAKDKTNAATVRAKMSGPVAELALAGGPQLVDLVISYDEHPELFEESRIEELGGEIIRNYDILDVQAIRIPASALMDFAIDDNVDRLSLDDAVTASSVSSRVVANLPLPSSGNSAYTGAGVGVAILDTGISAHADLGNEIRQYDLLNGRFPVPVISNGEVVDYNDDPRIDPYGHGTHVAGIVSGSGNGSGDQYRGSARDAKLLSLRILDDHGNGTMSDVMAALDWLLQYGAYFDVKVVNLSLGKQISESNTTDPLVQAVEQLWDQGVVVVIAAGNLGVGGQMTVKSPGNSRKALTVGSLTDKGTGADYNDDYVSSFSSRGPTVADHVLKPDLIAPGNRLVAAIPANSNMLIDLPDRVVPCNANACTGDYLELSGTSMATPMVAATVALMLQKEPMVRSPVPSSTV